MKMMQTIPPRPNGKGTSKKKINRRTKTKRETKELLAPQPPDPVGTGKLGAISLPTLSYLF